MTHDEILWPVVGFVVTLLVGMVIYKSFTPSFRDVSDYTFSCDTVYHNISGLGYAEKFKCDSKKCCEFSSSMFSGCYMATCFNSSLKTKYIDEWNKKNSPPMNKIWVSE